VQVWKLGIGKGGTDDSREFLSHRQPSVPGGAKVLFTWAQDGGEDEKGGKRQKKGRVHGSRGSWARNTRKGKESERDAVAAGYIMLAWE